MSESRIESIVTSGSVKQILFMPSGKYLWIVVGKDNEHWADLDIKFCTCNDFYFHGLSGGSDCYHLKSIRKAIEENKFVTVKFDDSEYLPFLKAIADDNVNLLSRG